MFLLMTIDEEEDRCWLDDAAGREDDGAVVVDQNIVY